MQNYFIQISECKWLQYVNNNYLADYDFVRLNTNTQSIVIQNQQDKYEIFDTHAVLNDIDQLKGEWTYPTACSTYKKGTRHTL